MIQRAAPPIDIAQAIASRIAHAILPWRIVLFGSRARGHASVDSDYDIFVEVDANSPALREIDSRIRGLFTDVGWSLDLKVQQRGAIERRRDDPGTIEWDVAREGKLLYADPAAATELRPPDRVSEPGPDPPASVQEWLEVADVDLTACRVLRDANKRLWPAICWHAHQSAEKRFKALLVARRVRPARTHDLRTLLTELRRVGCPLPELDADGVLLTRHAVTPRYPAGRRLDEEDARLAIAAAESVAAAVRPHLPPMPL